MSEELNLYNRISSLLKKARLKAGFTQVEVAEILKQHQSYVSKSESGERRVDIVELSRFAKLYKKPLNFL